jgi:hypothetical protein
VKEKQKVFIVGGEIASGKKISPSQQQEGPVSSARKLRRANRRNGAPRRAVTSIQGRKREAFQGTKGAFDVDLVSPMFVVSVTLFRWKTKSTDGSGVSYSNFDFGMEYEASFLKFFQLFYSIIIRPSCEPLVSVPLMKRRYVGSWEAERGLLCFIDCSNICW